MQPEPAPKSMEVSLCHKSPLKAALCKGLDALDLYPTGKQVGQLCRYLELLQQWNKVYNLTAVRDVQDMLTQHLLDCLAVALPLAEQCPKDVARVLDVGSGAGLPAVVLAVMFPEWKITAVDAVNKKTAFIQQVAGMLGLSNLHSEHARVEQMKTNEGSFDVIISRAFSTLVDFVTATAHLLASDGVWCAMKGKKPQEEIVQASMTVNVFHVEQLQVPTLAAERCLVWMRPLGR